MDISIYIPQVEALRNNPDLWPYVQDRAERAGLPIQHILFANLCYLTVIDQGIEPLYDEIRAGNIPFENLRTILSIVDIIKRYVPEGVTLEKIFLAQIEMEKERGTLPERFAHLVT